jgi:alpha-tubulin suppressor-like RCC1 family protein
MMLAFICKITGMIRAADGWMVPSVVFMLALTGSMLTACAGTNVVAWGAGTFVSKPPNLNDYGQSIVPKNLTNAVQVAGGWRHSMAVKANGTLEGWGDDETGQTNFPPDSNYVAVACGNQQSLALKSDGTVVVADKYDFYGEADVPANLSHVVAIACGFYHCLVLKSDGTLAAWGGVGDGYDDGHGMVPSGLSNVVAIASGGYHNLVLKSDGTLFAWGDNTYGETNIPAGLSNSVAIAAGGWHNLALNRDGTVTAWGQDQYGQTDVPAGLSNVVAAAAGEYHSLALKSDGTVVAWGLNTEGDTNVPFNLTNVVQIAAGDVHSLAVVGTGPPVTQAVSVQPGFGTNGFNFRLPTQNGRVYQLEFKNSLADSVWQTLPLVAGTGKEVWFNDPAPSSAQRFYRVLRW